MAKYHGSVCRFCRREGLKLYLKGDRCYSDKCAVDRRNYPPGQHGQGRIKYSDYGLQLREKQKVKRIYGMLERQFRQFFAEALRSKGSTGERLLILMERRLDNVVYRLGFTSSRKAARQLVNHGHIMLNDRLTNIPSLKVKPGDVISVRDRKSSRDLVLSWLTEEEGRVVPPWLSADPPNFRGEIKTMPAREDVSLQLNEQLIVEFCSR